MLCCNARTKIGFLLAGLLLARDHVAADSVGGKTVNNFKQLGGEERLNENKCLRGWAPRALTL